MMSGSWDGGPWGAGMVLVWILFLVLVVGGIVLIIHSFSQGDASARGPEGGGALDILDQRFARGEIDREEYEERRRVLREK